MKEVLVTNWRSMESCLVCSAGITLEFVEFPSARNNQRNCPMAKGVTQVLIRLERGAVRLSRICIMWNSSHCAPIGDLAFNGEATMSTMTNMDIDIFLGHPRQLYLDTMIVPFLWHIQRKSSMQKKVIEEGSLIRSCIKKRMELGCEWDFPAHEREGRSHWEVGRQ